MDYKVTIFPIRWHAYCCISNGGGGVMGYRSTCKLLTIGLIALCLAGCGTTGATASVPTSVPTTIEYASGDAIISGTIANHASASISAGKSVETCSVFDGIYTTTPTGSGVSATAATFDDSGNFAIPGATGSAYSIVFTHGSTICGIFTADDGTEGLTTFFSDSAAAASEIAIEDAVSLGASGGASDVPIYYLGDVAGSADVGSAFGSTVSENVTAAEIATATNSNSLSDAYTVELANFARNLDVDSLSSSISTDKAASSVRSVEIEIVRTNKSSETLPTIFNRESKTSDPERSTVPTEMNVYVDHGGLWRDVVAGNVTIIPKTSRGEATTYIAGDGSRKSQTTCCSTGQYVVSCFCNTLSDDGLTGADESIGAANFTDLRHKDWIFEITRVGDSSSPYDEDVRVKNFEYTSVETIVASIELIGSGTTVTGVKAQFYKRDRDGNYVVITSRDDIIAATRNDARYETWLQVMDTSSDDIVSESILSSGVSETVMFADATASSSVTPVSSIEIGQIDNIWVSFYTINLSRLMYHWSAQ